jgi:agmatine/peptidylarginine deiminase
LLDRLFRDAGLRIANDRQLRTADWEFTLDGYDPEQGVGYEYIAAEERGTDISDAEAVLLRANPRILVLEGGTLDELETRARAFLADLSEGTPGPQATGIP